MRFYGQRHRADDDCLRCAGRRHFLE
jgi:hypothetical protein